MKTRENRRTFLRQFGLAVGAITIGAGDAGAFVYQKTSGIRKGAAGVRQTSIDFRYAPQEWTSPVRAAGAAAQAFVEKGGSLLRPAEGGSVGIFIDGAGVAGPVTQRCEEPHIPFVLTSVSYGEASVEMTAFSTVHEDEGAVDNILLAVDPGAASPVLRLVLKAGTPLRAEVEEDDDRPNGGICTVVSGEGGDRPFLVIDARPVVSRDGDALVLTIPVKGGAPAPARFTLRLPSGKADAGDIADGIERLTDRAAEERRRWNEWKTAEGPAGWDLPGAYGEFSVAGARILAQLTPAPAGNGSEAPRPAGAAARPDLVDEHFISEAELYVGREKAAKRRLEAVWSLEDEQGRLVGAGGESNTKEMCAAVYSLCRHAELTGDWTMFNELYPDAYNALDSLKQERDRLAALPEKSANIRRNLLREGSPGRGWTGEYPELTNSLWALMALKIMLDISDRQFLMKKSELREFYGQLLVAVNTSIRESMQTDPAGYTWFPVVGAPAGAPGGTPAQAGLGTLSLALFPGTVYKKEEKMFQGFPALVKAALANDIPAGTGPGGPGVAEPVDAALAAQALAWMNLPGEAAGIFAGFLNHASPVFTWRRGAGAGDAALPDLRATAESLRFLRHAMVMEDGSVLRLFDGIVAADLAASKPLRIEHTPTRWGRVSVSLEPVDARTWKATYRREPVNPDKAPQLASLEMPRVLGPNFRFDTITPGSAIKNGPRVLIDAGPLAWEAYLKDLRR